MLYMISYDLKSPGRDYTTLYEAIKSFGVWWHYLESTWIIKTSQSVAQVSELIRQRLDANDYLIVVDITGRKCDGWLPQKAWDWIRDNDRVP